MDGIGNGNGKADGDPDGPSWPAWGLPKAPNWPSASWPDEGDHSGSSGGKQIRKLTIHTAATILLALLAVMIERYLTGRVTATYLSMLIAHRFSMLAVEIQTSVTSHPLHQTRPKIHTSSTCLVVVVGSSGGRH